MKSREIKDYLPALEIPKTVATMVLVSVAFLCFCFSFFFSAFFCFPVFFAPAPSSTSPLGFFSCSSLLPVMLFFPGFLVLSPSPVSSAFVLHLWVQWEGAKVVPLSYSSSACRPPSSFLFVFWFFSVYPRGPFCFPFFVLLVTFSPSSSLRFIPSFIFFVLFRSSILSI
jgi:hypothetical protein